MKKGVLLFLLMIFSASFFAFADDDDDDDDFRAYFNEMERAKMRSEMQKFWNQGSRNHAMPPPSAPLNPQEKKDLKRRIHLHNTAVHWERRCRDAQEAPPREWQKFLRKWHKKQRKLQFMASVGDLHHSAAADYYMFGNFGTNEWENFRATCHNGMPADLKNLMQSLEIPEDAPHKKHKKYNPADFPR